MATLTYVAYVSRRIIKYGGVGLIAFLFFWWGLTASIAAYRKAHPPYSAPTVRFGILGKIVFPEKTFEKKNFTAELADDKFPKYKDQANVYVIYRSKSALGALEESKKTAALMGFNNEPREVATGIYLFTDTVSNKSLKMNVLESSFTMSYPYLSDQLLLNPDQMPSKDEAIKIAKNYLQQAEKLSTDLDEGEKKVTYWKINFDGLKEVQGLSEANIIRVDFYRQKLGDNVQVVSTEVKKASVSVLVSGSSVTTKKVVEVNYKHVDVDTSAASSSTYPIKTTEEAFAELKAGNYWPASDTDKKEVTIRNIYLAYFEPVNLTQFLQPVYVFEDNNGFVAYVRAITDKYAR
jgi:hypothetical protein